MLHTAVYIPWIAALGAVICGALCLKPAIKHLAGPVCVLSIAAGFVLTLAAVFGGADAESGDDHAEPADTRHAASVEHDDEAVHTEHHGIVHGEVYPKQPTPWIHVGKLKINYGYYFDGLTFTMMLIVTGIGLLIAIYAMGYMKGDPGVARFFSAMALFIFAMTTLVMADNLVLLFLGWEGVGLCSYLLIGYYYDKPTAVAAAKKAFIVNRIGDFGFLIGIFLCYTQFGGVDFQTIFSHDLLTAGSELPAAVKAIPYCLMLGAFGKSAQIPLFVWLPDAMAGPTPVSALVHAATMVTAGVYLIARMFPVFELVPSSLVVVACVGGFTALFAGTIALTNNDLKGVFAYSTVSQLGYMFLGLGAYSTSGAVFHLVTHAFFKALLFLTAGSVMHALAGTLDIRTMGGLGKKMPVTKWLMLVGCLALAGFPFTAGFFSKDEIIAATLGHGLGDGGPLYILLAIVALLTAMLTAFYTFRLWCIVFTGPEKYEMGDEHHAPEGEDGAHGHSDHHAHAPHEMPWWPMNAPLLVLAIGSITAGLYLSSDWTGGIANAIHHSSAAVEHGEHNALLHYGMMVVSGILSLAGIGFAFAFYTFRPQRAETVAKLFHGPVALLRGKYFIDEFYDRVIVRPLFITGQVLYLIDQLVIHATIMSVGWVPRLIGRSVQPTQTGRLQGYGLGMVAGVAAIALLLLFLL